MATPHCWDAISAAGLNKDTPSREMVGQIQSGPINRSINPIAPVIPNSTSNSEATMMEPFTCDRMVIINYSLVINKIK